MPMAEISVAQIADWLLFRKGMNRSIVVFWGSRAGGLYKNEHFYNQIQNYSPLQFDGLNELERYYECYWVLSQLDPVERENMLKASLAEGLEDLSEYRALANLVKEGYVDVIITTGVDPFLEKALQQEKVNEARDYRVLVY